jgi:hypothetical protein
MVDVVLVRGRKETKLNTNGVRNSFGQHRSCAIEDVSCDSSASRVIAWCPLGAPARLSILHLYTEQSVSDMSSLVVFYARYQMCMLSESE